MYLGRTDTVTRTLLNHTDTINELYLQMPILPALVTARHVCKEEYDVGYFHKNCRSDTGI
jgi:hypothetical protein